MQESPVCVCVLSQAPSPPKGGLPPAWSAPDALPRPQAASHSTMIDFPLSIPHRPVCCCSGPTCRAARRRGAYRSSRPRLSTYAPVEPDSLIENQNILGKKAPSLTPIGNFHFILATRFSHSSSHSSISRWCTGGGGVLLSNFQVPTFQTSNIFFPVVSLLPCGCVVITCCGSTRVVRPFSFYFRRRVLRPRKKKRGEGVSP